MGHMYYFSLSFAIKRARSLYLYPFPVRHLLFLRLLCRNILPVQQIPHSLQHKEDLLSGIRPHIYWEEVLPNSSLWKSPQRRPHRWISAWDRKYWRAYNHRRQLIGVPVRQNHILSCNLAARIGRGRFCGMGLGYSVFIVCPVIHHAGAHENNFSVVLSALFQHIESTTTSFWNVVPGSSMLSCTLILAARW